MFGVTLSVAEIKGAPVNIRRWLEAEVARTLGLRSASCPSDSSARQKPAPQNDMASTGDAKMVLVTEPATDEAIHKLIAVRAYELWENQGRPQGYDVINWHQAEQEILSCIEKRTASNADKPDSDRPAEQSTPILA